jgi:glycosyltransferase involved in cell wall biosynthesis
MRGRAGSNGSNGMPSVLLVAKGPPDRGGISAYVQGLLASDLARTHHVSLLNLFRDEALQGGRLTWRNILRTLADAWMVWRASREFEIVHTHTALTPHVTLLRAGFLALAGRIRRRRVVVHVHSGRSGPWLSTKPRRLLARMALLPAQVVVTVSEDSQKALASILGSSRVRLIDNGVDLADYGPPGQPHDPPRILYAGVLSPRKGLLDLLEASAILTRRGVRHEILLVGGTPERGEMEEAVVRQAAGPTAHFIGAQPHDAMPALYRDADLLCLPSWTEGMPLSILEGMATGLPVVATAVGDIPRAVADGLTGRLVPPRDPQALAGALDPLLRSPDLRGRMGAAGRRRAEEHFGMDQTCRALGQLYREVAAVEDPVGPASAAERG